MGAGDVVEETAPMSEHTDDNEIVAAASAGAVSDAGSSLTAADRAEDEIGEASFPASDPPASWTWDVGGNPPESATPY
jgi:hypothetical protein